MYIVVRGEEYCYIGSGLIHEGNVTIWEYYFVRYPNVNVNVKDMHFTYIL